MQRLAAEKEKDLVKKAKANVNPFAPKTQDVLIELQDNKSQVQKIQQQQQHEEQNLRMLEEQEANIRQLEVRVLYNFFYAQLFK